MVSLTKREAIKIIESTNREYERFLCNLNRRYHARPESLSPEAAVLAQQYDDVYRCVNSSLWQFYKNTKSGDLKAILDEYLALCRNFNFRTLQSFPKEEFTVSETEDKMPEAIEAALEKLEKYGDEQIQKAARQCREGKRIIEFSNMDERQNGQTYRVNDFYSHYITDRFKENSIENQIRLAVTLAHELKRNAATDSLDAETQEIVLNDTKIIESFANAYGEGIYKKFPEYGILHYIKKIFGETELKEFADYAFDSTGSYWKVNEAGDLADDGNISRVADAKGNELHSGTKGLQGTLQEWLGLENAYTALMQPAGFEWDGKQWSKNPGKISNSILKQKLTEQQYELIKNAANLIDETDGKEEKNPEKVNYMQLIIQNLKDAIKSPFQLNLISSVIKYFILDHYAENNLAKHKVIDRKSTMPTKSADEFQVIMDNKIRYTRENPINQEYFDSHYDFSSSGRSVSCKTNSLINIYAAKFGITQSQLDKSVETWKKNGYIDDDGSPIELNKMSKTLATELGLSEYYSFIYSKDDNYKQLKFSSQADFDKSEYEVGIQKRTKPGYTHYTATVKNLFGKLSVVMDSLKPNRSGAEDYSVINIEPMALCKLPEKDTK